MGMLIHDTLEELEKQNGADSKSVPTAKDKGIEETKSTDKPKRKAKAE